MTSVDLHKFLASNNAESTWSDWKLLKGEPDSKVEDPDSPETQSHEDAVMQLLYTGRYEKFTEELELMPELLRHRCRFCCSGIEQSDQESACVSDIDPLSVLFLVILTRDEKLTSRTLDLIQRADMWEDARCALFEIVDFCCSQYSSPTDEPQLARFFVSLSSNNQDACIRLLNYESTQDSLTPLEYAAAKDCFHLATAFANAPGFMIRIRAHPTNSKLAVEEIDLTRYSIESGDRRIESPFLQLLNFAMLQIGDQLSPGHLCFFNSPVGQAYFSSIGHLKPGWMNVVFALVYYLVMYFTLLSTLSIRIFTRDTFNSSFEVSILGARNSSKSYLQLVSPTIIAAFRYIFYLRIALQATSLITWATWLTIYVVNNNRMLKYVRKSWLGLRWLLAAFTLKGYVLEGTSIFFAIFQTSIIFIELYLFMDSSTYIEVEGRWFVDGTRLQVLTIVTYNFMLGLLLFFISDMALYFETFFYVTYCMSESLKLLYIISLPMVLVCCTMVLSQPYIECTLQEWTCVFEYFGRTLRYIFSLSSFPGIEDYLALCPQAMVFLLVAVFVLNFGIALLTQKISLLQENVAFRRTVYIASGVHHNELTRCQKNSGKKNRVVLQRTFVRTRPKDADPSCCCCLPRKFPVDL